jgi:UDP-N-acetylmuramoyl-tripeptide--D-alanyl-D-alanine ligase
MLPFTLGQLHAAIGGELSFADGVAGSAVREPVKRIVTDSRQVQPGDVFWALPGTLRDGSEFVEEAVMRGAAGVVTHRTPQTPLKSWTIRVEDSLSALWRLARWQRDQFAGRVVAVTGSVGKTTTRLMIDAVLARGGDGSTSPHNYNNHVGLPLAMLALRPHDTHAVLELAASGVGEIAELAGLCRPEVGVITCIGEAHLSGFGGREALAAAKGELLASLPAEGVAVLNGDDPWLRKLASRTRARVVWVGRGGGCEFAAKRVEYRDGRLNLCVDGLELEVPVWGRHHVTAVLMAVAVGREFGVPSGEITDALAGFHPPRMRCQVSRVRGTVLINDCYNASPTAMRAALELLGGFEAAGQKIVVCGDMRELGPESQEWHRRIGDEVVTVCGADLLVACGHYAPDVVGGARRAGMHPERTIACRHVAEAAGHVQQNMAPGDVVLVKGSRALALEQIVVYLQREPLRCAA